VAVDRPLTVYAAQNAREHPHSAGRTNVLRIAVVGDSVTFGPGNHRCDRFGNRLEWLLNLNDGLRPVEVETFAEPSALYQQSDALNRALKWRASIVLFALHLNDVEDWRNPDELVRKRARLTGAPEHKWLRPFTRVSLLARQMVRAFDLRTAERGIRRYYRHLYDRSYPGLELCRGAVTDYSERCRAGGAVMAAVLFPVLGVRLERGRYPCGPMHAAVSEIVTGSEVPFLDLLETYRAFPNSRASNIESVDDHLSEIGHRIAADAILAFLLDRGIVPPEYRPRNVRDPTFNARMFRKARVMGFDVPPGF
jgi:hypothetical protein